VALGWRRSALALALGGLIGAGGCAQPGTPVSKSEAAKLDVGDSRISVACGYREEATALERGRPRELEFIASIARSGAAELEAVYAHDRTHIYQGESVGAVVSDSISLLRGCGLSAVASRLAARTVR
jgi:hypothetical protein